MRNKKLNKDVRLPEEAYRDVLKGGVTTLKLFLAIVSNGIYATEKRELLNMVEDIPTAKERSWKWMIDNGYLVYKSEGVYGFNLFAYEKREVR